MVDISAGEFELPAWFVNESNWIFNLWNCSLISERKAESFVAVDWRRFKIWNLRRKKLLEVWKFLGTNGTARADKGGIPKKKDKKEYSKIFRNKENVPWWSWSRKSWRINAIQDLVNG